MIRTINVDVANVRNLYNQKGELILDRREKFLRIAQRKLQIFQSKEFREKILRMNRDHWLAGEVGSSPFLKMTNEEIYQFICEGREETSSEVDYEIDLQLRTYFTNNFVVGYMIPFRPDIWVNTKFFDTNPENKICSNMSHEWAHTLGARHGGNLFRRSFAYYMNEVVNDLYNKPLTSLVYFDDPVTKIPAVTKAPNSRVPVKTRKVCRPWWAFWRGPRCVEKVVAWA